MDIIDQYRVLHDKGGWFLGTAIKGYLGEIGKLVRETNSKSLLDYGCGKAKFYRQGVHKDWGIEKLVLYDPGVSEYAIKPVGSFDTVVCADVLEHVEDPEQVLDELVNYATKGLFLTISVRHSPPGKRLPDGRPLHISVHPRDWWIERIKPKPGVKLEVRFDENG